MDGELGGDVLGAIVDTLHLGESEISIIRDEYPRSRVFIQNSSDLTIQQYRVIIPGEGDTERYYRFLVDKGIAMSSQSFVARVASDRAFARRMRQHVFESLDLLQKKFKLPKVEVSPPLPEDVR